MQTFLPYSDFIESAKCLDYRRLGKQRVEALQIFNALSNPNYGWKNHPAVKMWKGYEIALILYKNSMIAEWIARGYKNTMQSETIDLNAVLLPPWLGNSDFHDSHRSNLLRKDENHYSQFSWNVKNNLEYIWPN